MAEYIERQAAIDLITSRYENPEICTAEINGLPAADVAPVVHGKWINEGPYRSLGGDWMKLQECSVCHAVYTSHGNTPWSNHKYCPNCGAKMDL